MVRSLLMFRQRVRVGGRTIARGRRRSLWSVRDDGRDVYVQWLMILRRFGGGTATDDVKEAFEERAEETHARGPQTETKLQVREKGGRMQMRKGWRASL